MGVFKNLFGGEKSETLTPTAEKSIVNLFPTYNFNILPTEDTFVKFQQLEDGTGVYVQRDLNTPVHGIFNYCTIRFFPNGQKTINFKNELISSVKIEDLKKFVNLMYKTLGPDDSGETVWTEKDAQQLDDQFWYGRMYLKRSPDVLFSMMGQEFMLSFSLDNTFLGTPDGEDKESK